MALPELVPTEEEIDSSVRFGQVARQRPDGSKAGLVSANAEEVYLYWKEAGAFLVRGGREILIDPASGVDERMLRLVVLGPCLGALLYQRGWLTLHASCINVDGEAVAFVGESGWGKSTMAATMCARGHSLVADDVTVVQIGETCLPIVYPGYPQLKLWPDAVASLGEDPETLPRLAPIWQKRARRVVREFSIEPLPLRRIYVLGDGDSLGIASLEPQKALVELIRFTYGRELFPAVETRSHFLRCTSLVNTVMISRLERQYSLAQLSELALLVERDLEQGVERAVLDAG